MEDAGGHGSSDRGALMEDLVCRSPMRVSVRTFGSGESTCEEEGFVLAVVWYFRVMTWPA